MVGDRSIADAMGQLSIKERRRNRDDCREGREGRVVR